MSHHATYIYIMTLPPFIWKLIIKIACRQFFFVFQNFFDICGVNHKYIHCNCLMVYYNCLTKCLEKMNEGIRFEKWLTAMCTEERLCNWPIWTSTSYTCICYLSVWSKRTNPLVRVHSIFEVSIQVGQLSQVQHGSLSKTSLHISYQN